MARCRNIKPSFFTNEDLVELPYEIRLLFIGLWTLADREGRLEDRPKKVKMEVFPSDDLDVDLGLDLLMTHGFIFRYESMEDNDGLAEISKVNKYIQILNFIKHQRPHHKEAKSIIPEPGQIPILTFIREGQTPTKERDSRSESLNPITESLNPLSTLVLTDPFDLFWDAYPKRRKKKTARESWKRKKLNGKTEVILADIEARKERDCRWLDGYVPDPPTYLNQERWEDEIETKLNGNGNGNGTHQQNGNTDTRSRAKRHSDKLKEIAIAADAEEMGGEPVRSVSGSLDDEMDPWDRGH